MQPIKSRRGVYYDLTKSPYGYESPYGDSFKFSSEKKLEIFTRDIQKEVERLDKLIERNNLDSFLPEEIKQLLYRKLYHGFYCKVEGLNNGTCETRES